MNTTKIQYKSDGLVGQIIVDGVDISDKVDGVWFQHNANNLPKATVRFNNVAINLVSGGVLEADIKALPVSAQAALLDALLGASVFKNLLSNTDQLLDAIDPILNSAPERVKPIYVKTSIALRDFRKAVRDIEGRVITTTSMKDSNQNFTKVSADGRGYINNQPFDNDAMDNQE